MNVVEVPATASAGQQQNLVIPAGIDSGTVQAVDDTGNLGRPLDFDLLTGVVGGGQRLFGKKLVMRDNVDPVRRRVRWLAKDPSLTAPLGNDRPTVAGATLEVRNPTTQETMILSLPAAGWVELTGGRFRYRDPGMIRGPVKNAILKSGKLIKVAARGSTIGYTLNESTQGSVSVMLTSGARHYCTLFGGQIKRDQVGKFVAVKAPAPPTCP